MSQSEILSHEIGLIKSFVKKDKKERFLTLISSAKGRMKFRKNLPHINFIDESYKINIPPVHQTIEFIKLKIKEKGGPNNCYVISENSEFDKLELNIDEALDLLFGKGIATFFSLIPGKFIYYEGEEMNERFFLEKKIE